MTSATYARAKAAQLEAKGDLSGALAEYEAALRAAPNDPEPPVSFAMLLNLASVVNADDPQILWGFLARYAPGATPATQPLLGKLVESFFGLGV